MNISGIWTDIDLGPETRRLVSAWQKGPQAIFALSLLYVDARRFLADREESLIHCIHCFVFHLVQTQFYRELSSVVSTGRNKHKKHLEQSTICCKVTEEPGHYNAQKGLDRHGLVHGLQNIVNRRMNWGAAGKFCDILFLLNFIMLTKTQNLVTKSII